MSDQPTVSDMMTAYARDAVDFAEAKFGETLDYSEGSVRIAERCLRQLYDAKPTGFLGKLFPPAKVHKRLVNGDEDNVWIYYQVLTREYLKPPAEASPA